jgi:hypothetical protein
VRGIIQSSPPPSPSPLKGEGLSRGQLPLFEGDRPVIKHHKENAASAFLPALYHIRSRGLPADVADGSLAFNE